MIKHLKFSSYAAMKKLLLLADYAGHNLPAVAEKKTPEIRKKIIV